jgi:hypothetical protein
MKRVLAVLVIAFSFQSDLFALQTLQMEIPVYSVVQTMTSRSPEPAEEQLHIQQGFVSLSWQSLDSDPSDLSPPKLISGGIYLVQQPPMPGSSSSRRRKGIIGRLFLDRIDHQGDLWKSFEMAYRQAVAHTGDITKIGTIEVNYFVDRPTSYFTPGLHETALAVHLMGLFRGEAIDDRSILLGILQTDGRIGPVFSLLSEKVALLIPHAQQILIPSGQLVDLNPTVMHQLQQHGTKVLEVDNLEQAYQLMKRSR